MADIDTGSERYREFLAEAEDILGSMGKGLLKLGKGVKAGIIDPGVLNAVFRSAHTLKGMSAIFDVKDMSALSHSLEDTLDLLRLGRITLTDTVLDTIMNAYDLLHKIVASKGQGDFSAEIERQKSALGKTVHARENRTKEQIDAGIISILTEYEEHRLRENLKEGRSIFIVTARFFMNNFDKGYVALIELLKTEAEVIATLPSSRTNNEFLFFDILVGSTHSKGHILELIGGSADVEIKVLAEPTGRGEQVPAPAPALEVVKDNARPVQQHRDSLRRTSDTVRVNIGKLDYILNVISELGIVKSDITALSAALRNEKAHSVYGLELTRAEKHLERKLSELRDSVLDVRMVQIGQLFGRFETLVNRISRESGKEIRMTTLGDETELDKLIVEELADPLMHIIRNIADHAIESAGVREGLGKPRHGTITLGAHQKGNHVVVEVSDDGAGIDDALIRSKAVEKGLVTAEYARSLGAQEALELIFLPGFSTRSTVSETSGRGVGMDVVRENITRLSGIIDIDTERGRGTRFILTIPITLAILQALIVEEAGVRYAVPLNSVIEIVEVERVSESIIEPEFTINGRNIPSVCLSRFLGRERAAAGGAGYGIVAGLAEHRVCIMVDRLVEELDVVIKPLSRLLKANGIAGATDMGEKGTVLVLDVTGILEHVYRERKSGAGLKTTA